jgi:hypothetical protein
MGASEGQRIDSRSAKLPKWHCSNQAISKWLRLPTGSNLRKAINGEREFGGELQRAMRRWRGLTEVCNSLHWGANLPTLPTTTNEKADDNA